LERDRSDEQADRGCTFFNAVFVGCGTTYLTGTPHKLSSGKWIGIDFTYQSLSQLSDRSKAVTGKEVVDHRVFDGIPRDVKSAVHGGGPWVIPQDVTVS